MSRKVPPSTPMRCSYVGLKKSFDHQVIDQGQAYAVGLIHTHGLESFWSLLKRTIKGTYVSVDPFHMFRYLDEQTFRFNYRKENDGFRFAHVVGTIMAKLLTYKNLIGQDIAPATT
jgi:hypothetical protein